MSGFAFTWYPHHKASRSGRRIEMDRDELRHALATAARHKDGKETLPLICPAIFRNEHRAIAEVEGVSMFGIDRDVPTTDPAAVLACIHEAMGGVEVFAYSTYSSILGAFNLRAFVPYDRLARGEEHSILWPAMASMLGAGGIAIDGQCKDPSRGYYVWCVPPSDAYWHGHLRGAPLPVAAAVKAGAEMRAREAERREREARRQLAALPRATGNALTRARAYLDRCEPAIAGANGSRTTLIVAAKLVHGFGLSTTDALALMRAEYNPRCEPPWSERDLDRKVQQAAEQWRGSDRGWLLNAERKSA